MADDREGMAMTASAVVVIGALTEWATTRGEKNSATVLFDRFFSAFREAKYEEVAPLVTAFSRAPSGALMRQVLHVLGGIDVAPEDEVVCLAEEIHAVTVEQNIDITDARNDITRELMAIGAQTTASGEFLPMIPVENRRIPVENTSSRNAEYASMAVPSVHITPPTSTGLDIAVPSKWDLGINPMLKIRIVNHQHRPRRLHVEVYSDTSHCQFRFESQVLIEPTDDGDIDVPCNYAAHVSKIKGTIGDERHAIHVRITEEGELVYQRDRLPLVVPPIRTVRMMWSKNIRFTSPTSFTVRMEIVNEGNVDLHATPTMSAAFVILRSVRRRFPYLLDPIDIPWGRTKETTYEMSCPAGVISRHFATRVAVVFWLSVNRRYLHVQNGAVVLPLDRHSISEMVTSRRIVAAGMAATLIGFVLSVAH